MDDEKPQELEAHLRLYGDLAKTVKERSAQSNRTIVAEIRRALRVAYKLGAVEP